MRIKDRKYIAGDSMYVAMNGEITYTCVGGRPKVIGSYNLEKQIVETIDVIDRNIIHGLFEGEYQWEIKNKKAKDDDTKILSTSRGLIFICKNKYEAQKARRNINMSIPYLTRSQVNDLSKVSTQQRAAVVNAILYFDGELL